MKHFGEQGYFVNFPSKFISADGRTLWLCYSANFAVGGMTGLARLRARPVGGGCYMSLQEVNILSPSHPAPPPSPPQNPLDAADNLAWRSGDLAWQGERVTTVTVSSTGPGYSA